MDGDVTIVGASDTRRAAAGLIGQQNASGPAGIGTADSVADPSPPGSERNFQTHLPRPQAMSEVTL